MEKEKAQMISELLEKSIQNLSSSLMLVESDMSDVEYEDFKRHIGLTIGKISYDLLTPIYKQYPDIAPPGIYDDIKA